MGSFSCETAQDSPRLREDLEQRIGRECQSVQATYLTGQNCYWQLRQQDDALRPYFARAIDKDRNTLLYTLCFDPDGRLVPNRLPQETSFPIGPKDPIARIKDLYLNAAKGAVESLGMAPVDVNLHRKGWSAVRGDNALSLTISVLGELPSDIAHLEEQIATECKTAAARNAITNAPHVQVTLEKRPKQESQPTSPAIAPISTSSVSAPLSRESTKGGSDPVLRKKASQTSLLGRLATPPRSPVARRVSSNTAASNRAVTSPKEPHSAQQDPPPQHTISSIANEFFRRDFATHGERSEAAKLAVILHDSCYGHRYSRPRTSKANLSTIVERPERILAITLGISTAYVLMGGRYAGAQHAPHPDCSPSDVPFVIRKSSRFVPLTSPAVTNVHGTKWMHELKLMCSSAEAKLATTGKELARPEDGSPGKPHFHEGDLYLCSESLDAMEGALGGVLDAVDLVFNPSGPKAAFVGIRPPGHHCSADYPAGFCWINNVHVGVSHAAAVHGLTHAAMIDFDLHHGDGSQAITWAHNARVASLPKNASFSKRTSIGYFSLHDINSYPCEWGDEDKVQAASLCIENAHGQTVWNTHLQPWKTNDEFWELYEKRYMVIVEKAREYLRRQTDRLRTSANAPQPRGIIFISAGFDASEWEGQGMQRHKVNVPTEFYERFTRDIISMSQEPGLAVDGRVVSVLEGGYSDRALTSGVMSHLSGMVTPLSAPSNIEHDLASRMDDLSLGQRSIGKGLDSSAWSPAALDELDAAGKPTAPPAPKKPRGPINPTYSTPTRSSTAKVHSSVNIRRSSSIANEPVPQSSVEDVAPGIVWAVAAHEFCRILVPDRQTQSCRPEDLNAEATRLRRERQSAIGTLPLTPAPAEDAQRMQLRGRKTKTAAPTDRTTSSGRRTTIEGSEIADLATADATPRPVTAPRRRVSVASTILSTTEEATEPPPSELRRSRRSSSIAAREASAAARSSTASSSRPSSSAAKSSRPASRPGSPSKSRARKTPASKAPTKTPTAARSNRVQDVDELEAGVKKMSIKLNLGPNPEAKPESRKKPVRAPRKPPTTSMAKASTPTSSSPIVVGSPAKSTQVSTSEATMPVEAGGDPAKIDATTMISPITLDEPAGNPSSSNGTGASFAVQPQGEPLQSPSSEIKQWPSPPTLAIGNTSTMWPPSANGPATPEVTRQRLPVFTSKSPIPFAAPRPILEAVEAGPVDQPNPAKANGTSSAETSGMET